MSHISQGRYETRDGHAAVVARLASEDGHWFYEGAINAEDNIFCVHIWNTYGNSMSGDPDLDLVRRVDGD